MRFSRTHFKVLYPFVVDASDMDSAANAIEQLRVAGQEMWQPMEDSPLLLHDNHISFVRERFLKHRGGTTRYFRGNPKVCHALMAKITAHLPGGEEEFCISSASPNPWTRDAGVDLFLSDFGVGIASFSFSKHTPIDTVNCLELVSRMHLGARWKDRSAHLQVSSPEATRMASVIGVKNPERFYLHQLLPIFLPSKTIKHRSHQRSFNVFFGGRLQDVLDFGDATQRAAVVPMLANLQNLWRADHAGIGDESMLKNHQIYNKRHWSALSRMCAAHIVSDQAAAEGAEAVTFNERRLERVMAKFFFPFLLSNLQHLAVQRITEDASRWARSELRFADETSTREQLKFRERELDRIRTKISCMPMSLLMDEVSNEDNPQAFYRLCLDTIGLPDATRQMHGVIDAIDRQQSSDRLATVGETGASSLQKVVHIQDNLEWIETFVVSFYAVELSHILGGTLGFSELHSAAGISQYFELIGLATVALVAGLLVIILTRIPSLDRRVPHSEKQGSKIRRTLLSGGMALLLGLVLTIGSYLLIGTLVLRANGSEATSAPVVDVTNQH